MTVTQIGVRGTRRLSLPLTAKDQADLDLIRSTPERLGSLPGNIDASSSDAALVHAVFEAGLAQIREAAETAGFPLERLTIEMTESALAENLVRAQKIACTFKSDGLQARPG